MRLISSLAAPIILALGAAGAAHADPCQAIKERGPLPAWVKPGASFSGAVRYVVDGDGLCVGNTSDPNRWIEIRLADFYAPELNDPGGKDAKSTLSRIAAGRRVDCRVTQRGRVRSYDRVIAVCHLNGRRLSDLMRLAGVKEGGRGRPK